MQRAIAHAPGIDRIGAEFVGHGAGVAVDFEPVAGRERVDAAKLEHAFRAIGKLAKHGEQIGNDNFVALPDGVQNFAAGEHAGDIAQPALENFDVNAEGEHVQSADLDPLPPMRRRVGIQIGAGETLQPDMVRAAEETTPITTSVDR